MKKENVHVMEIDYGEEYNVNDDTINYMYQDVDTGQSVQETEKKETIFSKFNYPGTEPNIEEDYHAKEISKPYNIYKDKGFQQSTSSNHTINQKPLSTKKQYKANKKAGIVSCPKCGSTSITTSNKKLSVKRGIGGAAVGAPLAGLTGGLSVAAGAVAGGLSSKKIYNVCMNCGHKWKP